MKSRTKILLGCICIIGGLLLSGCNSTLIDTTIASTPPTPSPTHEVVNVNLPVVQPVTALPTQSTSNEPTITKSSDQATVASNNAQQTLSTETKEKLPVFSSKQPQIMGLAIGEAQEKAIVQYGKPLETYIMEDPAEPITVYQYDGFSIGFNTTNGIQFVDVSSTKVNPGLSGLRLGQTSAQALELLGKPDKNTSYVISYNTKTAILKLDIDPKTKTIQSIKLFGVEES
ncbi:DUF4309 domain-containing protein [Paenibacillus psychroresistens]|uniref:DUF4309 domain-containing protein n=1 Tax=Paenibacillus psychroresistens TaxID=1778678 RepID=A0A6B8RPT8_9BACL|nr:DUF4309 domain-containing protein [Paenibacillus psychroresistens]QGQ97396.1 DUF4309 domain-containing protein [Paenibacillus psychroresistens]